MVDSESGPDASNCVSSRIGDCGLDPDGSPEEGQEDAWDGLDGAEGEWFSASVDSGSKREGASLALWHVGGAEDVCCGCQELASVVGAEVNFYVKWFQKKNLFVECFSPRANVNTIKVKAGDLDGNEAFQYEAEGHHGPHLHDLA